jgi:hypothetical protein
MKYKSLEQVIKELHNQYKNKPSPLSEEYKQIRSSFVPNQKLGGDIKNSLLGDFKPSPRIW